MKKSIQIGAIAALAYCGSYVVVRCQSMHLEVVDIENQIKRVFSYTNLTSSYTNSKLAEEVLYYFYFPLEYIELKVLRSSHVIPFDRAFDPEGNRFIVDVNDWK